MNCCLILMKKRKRNENLNNMNKDSYNEREISFIFQNKKESKKITISSVEQLKEELNKMLFPYYEITQGKKKIIINLDNEHNIHFFFKNTQNTLIYENIEKKKFISSAQFDNYHIDKTKFKYEEISPNYKKYFSEDNMDEFYMSKPTQICRFTLYFDWQFGSLDLNYPLKLYGPYKSGKTTAILYFHGRGKGIDNTPNNKGYFRSSWYLNLKYFFEGKDTKEEKHKIFEEELCCLFYKYEWYKNFIIECVHLGYFNFNFSNDGNFFEKVYSITDLFVEKYKVKETNIDVKDTIVIFDEYTYEYDINRKIDIFKKLCENEKKFAVLIETQLKTNEDINDFIEDLYIAPSIEIEDQLLKSFFYLERYTDIPEEAIKNTKFINNFGPNYYYYRKFKNSNKSIETFIEEEKSNLKSILDSNNKCLLEEFKLFLSGLIMKLGKIKLNDEIKNLLKILPLNYLYLERCEDNKDYIRIFPHIPLINNIIQDNIAKDFLLFSKTIDFKSINPILYGIIFDRIVHFKLTEINDKIFGQKRKCVEINKIYEGNKIFNLPLKEYVKMFKKIQVDNDTKIFSLNQAFSGQNYDEGLIIINNKTIDLLIIQTKTGKSFTISMDEVLSIPFELLYISKKIEKIFDMIIDNTFFAFVTDFDNKYIEDLCKKKSFNILYYNIKDSDFYKKKNRQYIKINNVDELLDGLKKVIIPKEYNKYIYSTELFSIKVIPNIISIKNYLGLKQKNKIILKGVIKFHDYFKKLKLNLNEILVIRTNIGKNSSYYVYSNKKIGLIGGDKNIEEVDLIKIISESSSYIIYYCFYI